MLDQEAAFLQIQEAKTMVEEDLQRRLEEFEDEKQQLQTTVASAAALEQQLEQASPSGALVAALGLRPASRGSLALVCPSRRQTRRGFTSARSLLCRSFTQKAASRASSRLFKTQARKKYKLLGHAVFSFKRGYIDYGSFFPR